MTKTFAIGLLLVAASALAGCGQKGSLYLPAQDSDASASQHGATTPDKPAPGTETTPGPAGT